jgi:DnaJ homolog subfamily C member 19
MLLTLLALAAVFALLFVARVGGARRRQVMKRWPALVLAGAALFAFARGGWMPGIGLALAAGVAWELWPRLAAARMQTAKNSAADPADADARAILGVGENATASEIRAAYRTRMAQAHPDRGGSHNEAARLAAARDRLLKKKP